MPEDLISGTFKVVVHACYRSYLAVHVFSIWHKILLPGDLHDADLYNF